MKGSKSMDSLEIRNTLDELIRTRGEDYASLSRLIGRNPTYVQQFIRRGIPRKLSEEDRRILARHLEVPESLLGGPQDRVGRAVHAQIGADAHNEDFVLIPMLDVGASAGGGAINEAESCEEALAFRTDWIRKMASGDPQALSVIRVEGDSMVPTLAHNDPILVDTADGAERMRDGIYVLRVDGALLVKRLAINPASRRINLCSDNEAYPTWSDIDPAQVEIIGRVIWVGRSLR